MAKIDDVFGNVPASILSTWGQTLTFVKTTTPRTYNPTTGAVTGSDTNVSVKGVITEINSSEDEGLYQTTDLKIVIGANELGDYYPTEADRVQYPQAGATREAKIIRIQTARGDKPIFHTLIVRPQ
jgi:hypothetical protein|tara:strand:- start:149 stop:526 length:378 start_codon:yes stop_codon:yes gene_type:complete